MTPRHALLVVLAATTPALQARGASTSPSAPAPLEKPLANDPMGATIHRLRNGLTVYLSPNKGLPRVTAWIAVRAGSKNDPADSTGIAHYLEHMLFKGTHRLGALDAEKEAPHLERLQELYESRARTKDPASRARFDKQIDAESVAAAAYAVPNEIGKFYRAIGAEGVNAFTSQERTVFVVSLPANRLEAWAAVEAERFSDPVFRLFPTELEAVYEEKNRSLDNAERAFMEELNRRLYKIHPYGQQTTLGSIEHLKNPSLTRLRQFYRQWYVPNNMAIALAGDFDPAVALRVIERAFGAWTPRSLPAPRTWALPRPRREETTVTAFDAEEKVALAWPTAASSSPDADALAVMDMVMDNSTSGLLNLRLNQAQRVKGSGSSLEMLNDAGAWYLWAVPKKDQTLEEAKTLLLEAVETLRRGDFDASDLDAIITNFEIGEKRGLESNDSRAAAMIGSFTSLEPWERTVGRLERLRRVTKDDVVRVARQYLGPDRIVLFRRAGKPALPRIDKPSLSELRIDPARQSAFLKTALAIPAAPLEPHWLAAGRDYQVEPLSGGRLYAARNPYNDLFTLTIRFERGWRHERRLCQALDLLELSGAGPYTAEQFKRKLYALGTSLSYSCGEQVSGISLSGLDRNFWPSLELMAQRFDWPNVSSGTLARMIDVELGDRVDEKKDPARVFAALGALAERGRGSPVLARLTNAELKALSEDQLRSLIRDFPFWRRRVGYVGPRSPSEVAKLLATSSSFKPAPARAPLRLLQPRQTRVVFAHREMVQARVGLSAPDEPYDPERAVDDLFYSDYMGGDMGSVIFQEVREARALAYSARGGHTTFAYKDDDTRLWGALGCQADKTPEAVSLMLALLRDFPSSERRFAETTAAIEQEYRTKPVEFRAIPETVMNWEDEGVGDVDPGPRRFARLQTYALADLEAFARRFKGKPMTIWILGQRDRLGLDRLQASGVLEEKGFEALFPY